MVFSWHGASLTWFLLEIFVISWYWIPHLYFDSKNVKALYRYGSVCPQSCHCPWCTCSSTHPVWAKPQLTCCSLTDLHVLQTPPISLNYLMTNMAWKKNSHHFPLSAANARVQAQFFQRNLQDFAPHLIAASLVCHHQVSIHPHLKRSIYQLVLKSHFAYKSPIIGPNPILLYA